MIYAFIIFFLFLYLILEAFKYNNIKTDLKSKSKNRTYRMKVLYIKPILVIIEAILLIINRFVSSGLLERSNSVRSTLILILVVVLLFCSSLIDLKKAKGETK